MVGWASKYGFPDSSRDRPVLVIGNFNIDKEEEQINNKQPQGCPHCGIELKPHKLYKVPICSKCSFGLPDPEEIKKKAEEEKHRLEQLQRQREADVKDFAKYLDDNVKLVNKEKKKKNEER
jgi:hypothetical protein